MHAKGKALLLQAYAKPKPRKSTLKAFLHRIFHTKDDDFIEDCLRACRGSSFRLLTYVGENLMPKFTETAIANLALLVTLNENGQPNKDHQAKKQFSILCTILQKAMQRKDHNTAWIVDKALRSGEVQCLQFKRPKRFKTLVKKIATKYGLHDRLYAKHIYQCIQAQQHDDKEFIPAAPVLDIHLRRSKQYRKSMQKNGCKKEWIRGAQRGTKLIEDMVAFYKITLGQNTQLPLIKLYTQPPPKPSEKTNLLIPTLLEY